MTTSEICSDFPHGGYQVIQSPTWDARWQINQFLGMIHDLILIIDCAQQQIYILPTEVAPNLSSESNPFSQVLQELQNPQESSEFTPLIQQVLQSQVAQHIIYKCDQNRQDYQILVEIYPLSKTEIIAIIKDLSQCSTVKAVLQKVSEKNHSPTLNPTPALKVTKECLKKQIEERKLIENQLKTRKTELETLMDNAGDCIVRLDRKLRYLFVNRRTAFITQIAQEKFIGKTNRELGIADPVAKKWDQNCQQALGTGQPQQFEFDLETSEGIRVFQTLIVPEIQQGGEVKTLLATSRDITQQKRALAEIQKQNQFLNLLTEITSKIRQSLELNLILKTTVEEVQKVLNVDRVIMLKLHPQKGGTVVQEAVMPQWSSLLSHTIYTPELTPYLSDTTVPDRVISFSDLGQENLEDCYLKLMEFFQVKASLIVPIWLEKKEINSIINLSENSELTDNFPKPKPKLWGFMMAHQCAEPREWTTLEINFLKQLADQVGIALKQAQLIAELKQAHQCLSCHFDNSPLAVIEWDQQLKIKRWSSQAERIFGWTSAEVLGQQWSTFKGVFGTNILQMNQQMIHLIDGTDNHQIFEAENRTKDGRVIDCEWYNSIVRDEDGNLVSLLSLAQNVSDRKQAEQELVKSEERFRSIFEQAAVGFALVNQSGKLLRVNQRYCRITGYAQEQLIGSQINDFIHHPNAEAKKWLEEIQDQSLIETFSVQKQCILPDGQLNWVQIFVSPVNELWKGKNYILLALEDIEERKQTEEALRKSEERWQLALRGNNDGIWDWNIQTREVFFSPRWKEMLGYHEQEICDHLTQWNQRVHPDDLPGVMKAIRDHLDQKTPFYITEHRVLCKDGSYKWILDRGQALWDRGGNLVRMVGSYTDISDRKRAEQELHQVNRALRTISDCNQALVRATTESELLNDICETLINVGGYHFAWVGYTQYTSDKQIIPVAKAGFEAGYLDDLTVTWDDSPWGKGPSGTAVRTGQTCVFQNFDTNADYAPWKQQAQKRGYTSSIALPLIMTTEAHNQHLQPKLNAEMSSIPFGVLNLYSTQANAFDPAEVKLLKELVNDIVYGIMALRIRASHAETEKKFRQLAENIDDVFWITNALGNQFIYLSPAYQQIWHRNPDPIYQNFQVFINTIHPQDQNRVLLALQNPEGRGFDLEYRILRPDGSYRWIWDRGFPILNETGQLDRRGGIAKDITQRKETEQLLQQNNQELELRVTQRTAELETANERLQFELMQRHRTEFKLRKSEEQYRTLVKNFPDGAVFLVDLDLRYTIADGMGLVLKGLSRKMLEGKTIWQVLPTPLLEIVEPLYRLALAGEITISEVEYEGRIYYHQALPVRNEQDEIFAGMVVMQDITQRKQAEAERDKLISIIEATPDFISSATPGGEIVYYNQSARRILGLDREGKISNQHIPKNHPQWALEIIENEGFPTAIREGSWIGETALTSYDGREIPLSQLIIAHKNHEGQVYLFSTMARDITEQKQSQANLLEAERRWRSLLENVRLLVVGLDRYGKVEYVNRFLLEVMGYTQTEVLGKNWLSDFQENSAQRLSASDFAELLDYHFKPYSQQLIETKLGEEKIISWNHTLLKDLQGNAIGMMSIGEDITERDAIERMKDEFISVVSHELRTPLTSIHGGLNLLSTGLIDPQSERGVHVMKIAAESAERLVRLVNDILELERLESGKIFLNKQVVNSTDLLLRATEQMQVMASRIGINLEFTSQSLEFYADPDRILQVLTNLLSNAIKFSESGDNIKLSVQMESPGNLVEQPKILFKIQDQGRGIPPDKIEKIFERFHQVDASDSRKKGGTGLGLAICRSIVEQHGGQIWVRSKVDQGSCFYFTLPMAISTEVES